MAVFPFAHADIGEEEVEAVTRVLRSGRLGQGEVAAEFEETFARYIGTRHAVAVSSGTAALHLALLAHGIGPGDEVITPALSLSATTGAMLLSDATPVYADIDPKTYTLDPVAAEAAITPGTRALLPVHLFGCPCDMSALMDIAHRHRLTVIEDACQAHGAQCCGKKVGSFGTGCFSFGRDAIMTTGEGGMLTTNHGHIARMARGLRDNHFSYRMTDVAAAIGLCQLCRLDHYIQIRIDNAQLLTEGLSGIPGISTPKVPRDIRQTFNKYVIGIGEDFPHSREVVQEALGHEEMEAAPLCSAAPHHSSRHSRGYRGAGTFPVANLARRQLLALSVHPLIETTDVQRMAAALRAVAFVHPDDPAGFSDRYRPLEP